MKDPGGFVTDLARVLDKHRVVLGYGGEGYVVARDADTGKTFMAVDFLVNELNGAVSVRFHVEAWKILARLRATIDLGTYLPGSTPKEDAILQEDFRREMERAADTEDLPLVDRDNLFAQAGENGAYRPGDMIFVDRYLGAARNYRLAMQGIRDTAEKLRTP